MFLFIDLETTGLNYSQDIPIEVGMILTDNKLNFIDAFSRVLPVKNWDYEPRIEVVHKMHTDNNLLSDLRTMERVNGPYYSFHEVDTLMYNWLNDHWLHQTDKSETIIYPAGSSVHFDVRFCEKFFPTFSSLLHHRHLDVSSIKLAHMIEVGEYEPGPEDKHRAIDDLLNDLAWLRKYLSLSDKDYPSRESIEKDTQA